MTEAQEIAATFHDGYKAHLSLFYLPTTINEARQYIIGRHISIGRDWKDYWSDVMLDNVAESLHRISSD